MLNDINKFVVESSFLSEKSDFIFKLFNPSFVILYMNINNNNNEKALSIINIFRLWFLY